jgi:hypothetical protein
MIQVDTFICLQRLREQVRFLLNQRPGINKCGWHFEAMDASEVTDLFTGDIKATPRRQIAVNGSSQAFTKIGFSTEAK